MVPKNDEGILNLQRVWLDKLQEISRKPVTVKAIEGAIPDGNQKNPALYQWMFFKDVWAQIKAPIWTRRILDNEIVFDPDVKNWQVLREEMNKLIFFCRTSSIPFYLAYTGGSGVHLSIYMKPVELDSKLLEEAYERDIDISKIIRQVVVNYLLESSKTDAKKLALDTKKYNFSKMRSGSQLREYGTPRENGGFKTLIDKIPALKPIGSRLPLRFPDAIILWDISPLAEKIDLAVRDVLESATRNNEANLSPITLTDCKIGSFPCIKALIDKGRTSARYYGGQSIALMMKKCGYTWESSESTVLKYFKKCAGLTKADIEKRLADVKNTVTEYEYNFSCREFKEIFGQEYCLFSKCPISNKVKLKKANADKQKEKATESSPQNETNGVLLKAKEIADKGDPVKFILDTHQKMHVGDASLALSLLVSIGCQSVENSDGIHPKVSGESGKGKTHCCRAMSHLIPDGWRCETTLSDKAIYYIKLISGSVIFSDDVALSESLEGIVKRATSNYQKGDTYKTVDSQRNPLTLTVPPRITWWLTSVDDNQGLQLLNRQFGGGVDDSEEQDKKVMDFQLRQAIEGEVSLPETFDVLVCREILRDIKSVLFRVKIPYLRGLRWYDTENRRNLPIFLDIIKAFAVLRHKQRPVIDGYLIAMPQDFIDAQQLYTSRAETQKLKLSDTERRICEYLRDVREADTRSICTAIKISQGRVSQIMNGADRKTGLLAKVKGLSMEKVSVKDNDVTTHKNMYMLSDFNIFDSLGYVVELGQEGIDDFSRYYPTFIPLLDTILHNSNYSISKKLINTSISDTKKSSVFSQKFSNKKNCSCALSGLNSANSPNSDSPDSESGTKDGVNNGTKDGTNGQNEGNSQPENGTNNQISSVEQAGRKWEQMHHTRINSTNLTAFCLWYCENVDSTDVPSVVKEAAKKVFAITQKRYGISYLCKNEQHAECGGYECSCDCHEERSCLS